MAKEVHDLTPSGRIRKPSYSLVCSWVKNAWEKVDVNLIIKSFKCCGISVKTDGTEDDFIFDYEKLALDDLDDHLFDEVDEAADHEFNEEDIYNSWDELNSVN